MIHLLHSRSLRGPITGARRYNEAISRRLEAAALGQGHDLTIDEFTQGPPPGARLTAADVVVVDSLFIEHTDPPAWLSELPSRVLLLMHSRPSENPNLSPEQRTDLDEREQAWSALACGAIATGAGLASRLAHELDLHCTLSTPGVSSCFRQQRLPSDSGAASSAPFEIVSVGALSPTKGQLELVSRLASLTSKRPMRLTLLGGEENGSGYSDQLRRAAGELELRIESDPSVDKVAEHLARADLFVSASRYESYGMSVAEAAASGVPILAYDVGELARWIDPGISGRLVALDDQAGFDAALEELVLSTAPRLGLDPENRRRFYPTWEYTFSRFLTACHPSAQATPVCRDVVTAYSQCNLPTQYGDFRLTIYRLEDGEDAILLQMGTLQDDDPPFVRVHSECFTGETLHSLKCDCRAQLEDALQAVAERARGAVIYLRQEGRGIGLGDKVRAYAQQERGADTVEANQALGLPVDLRDFQAAAAILKEHSVSHVRLNTNNPDKVVAFEDCGLQVSEVIGSHSTPNAYNLDYLRTKMRRMGHLSLQQTLDLLGAPAEDNGKVPGSNGHPLGAAQGTSHPSGSANGIQEQNGKHRGGPSTQLAIFDLDGVIQMGDDVPAAAVELIERLRSEGLTLRFLTNDGVNTRAIRSEMLRRHGLEVDPEHIHTGASLAARYVREKGGGPVLALCGHPALEEFEGLELVRENARIVVVGDFFDHYDVDLLRGAYHSLEEGAELVAIHRKRTWPIQGKRLIDIGFWVSGLEYCSQRPAAIVAKPAAYSYRTVMEDAGFRANDTIMISDEYAPDLEGAVRCGIRSVHFTPGSSSATRGLSVAADYEQLYARIKTLVGAANRSPSSTSG